MIELPDPEWVHERSHKQYSFNMAYASIFEQGYRAAIAEWMLKDNEFIVYVRPE